MFFADPVAAFANIRKTIHPGGPLAFACWQSIFSNEWMLVPGSAVLTVTGELPPMPGPGEPGPFSLSEPGRVEEVLGDAGFTHVEVVAHDEVIVLVGDEIESLVQASQAVGPVRQALQDADDGPAGPPDRRRPGRGATSGSSTVSSASAPAPSSCPPAPDPPDLA